MFFPNAKDVPDKKPEYFADSCLVVAGNVGLVALALILGHASNHGWASALFFGWILPYIVWSWLMGFVIYQHHTHPSVSWFDNSREWEFWESQIEGSTHIRFPRLFNFLLHNIMEHTAHHALTGIPLYRLKAAQDRLERDLSSKMVVVDWTPTMYLRTLSRCKLYDYAEHRWLDFRGRPTSNRTVGSTKAFTKHAPQNLTETLAMQ